MVLGSTTKLQNQLIIARDLKYLSQKRLNKIVEQITEVHKRINSLIEGPQNNPSYLLLYT